MQQQLTPYGFTACRYRNTYRADPANYHAPDKTSGGYWFEDRQRKAAGDCPPFLATTTYKSELLEAPETTAKQLQQAEGCTQTLVSYKVARDRRWGPAGAASNRESMLCASADTASTNKYMSGASAGTVYCLFCFSTCSHSRSDSCFSTLITLVSPAG